MENVLTCQWRKLAFANYIVPPELVKKWLPAHTQIDYYNGNCFVSLVGFQFKDIKVAGVQVPLYADFEEINLRFYVKRFDGSQWRKGTVFISEIVQKSALGLLANSLLQEHYQIRPTSQAIVETPDKLDVKYSWNSEGKEQYIQVISNQLPTPYDENSQTEFLLHRLFGYGRINGTTSREYRISHVSWPVYRVDEYSINIDFAKAFDPSFSMLSSTPPHSVMLAEGSKVQVQGIQKISS